MLQEIADYMDTIDKAFLKQGGHYLTWKDTEGRRFKLSSKEANKAYIELSEQFDLSSDKDFIDYNYLVDDILHISPPYQQGQGSKKEEVRVEPPEPPLVQNRKSFTNNAIIQSIMSLNQDAANVSVPSLKDNISISDLV